MLDADAIRRLGEGRWVVPVMAELSRERGARFAVLARRLDISRHSLARTLDQLRQWGWAMPNPGHGHPLRPEYVLSAAGVAIGAACERIMAERTRLGLEPGDLQRWSLPLVASLADDWRRFGDLQARLDPVTPRALSQTIKQMVGHDIVARRLENRYPPLPLYGLTRRGRDLAESVLAA